MDYCVLRNTFLFQTARKRIVSEKLLENFNILSMGCCFACFWNDDVNENNQNDIVSIGALSNLSGQEPAAVVTTAGDAREKNDKEKVWLCCCLPSLHHVFLMQSFCLYSSPLFLFLPVKLTVSGDGNSVKTKTAKHNCCENKESRLQELSVEALTNDS